MHHTAIRDLLAESYYRQFGQHAATNQELHFTGATIQKGDDVKWTDSLLQWMDHHQMSFFRTGVEATNWMMLSESQNRECKKWGICSQEDIACSVYDYHDLLSALGISNATITLTNPIIKYIRQAQFWVLTKDENNAPTSLLEIMGWEENIRMIFGNVWNVNKQNIH